MDATNSNRLRKFLNDSNMVNANSKMSQFIVDGRPKLCLFVLKNIPSNAALKYDYKAPELWCRNKKVIPIFFSFVGTRHKVK